MISKKACDEIQRALTSAGKPHKERGEKGFLFLNFATCATCGHCITAERHTKRSGRRYGYYHCSHRNKLPHSEVRGFIPHGTFANEVKRNVALVAMPSDWKEKFLAQIEIWQNDEAQTRQRHVDRIRSNHAALKSKTDGLNTAFTEGGLELPEFRGLKNPLIVQKTDLEERLAKVKQGNVSPIEPLKNLVIEANQAEKWVLENNWLEMKSFLQKSDRTDLFAL